MQMKRTEKKTAGGGSTWEITGGKEELPMIGKFLQAAAFEGVGEKEKKLAVSINGHSIDLQSNRELWMFGYGLEVSHAAPKDTTPAKEKVRVAVVKKEEEKKEETPFTEWDKEFETVVKAEVKKE